MSESIIIALIGGGCTIIGAFLGFVASIARKTNKDESNAKIKLEIKALKKENRRFHDERKVEYHEEGYITFLDDDKNVYKIGRMKGVRGSENYKRSIANSGINSNFIRYMVGIAT